MSLFCFRFVLLALSTSVCVVAACGASTDDTSNTPGTGADENAGVAEYEGAAENGTSQLGSSDGDCVSTSPEPTEPSVKGEEIHTIPTPPVPGSACDPTPPSAPSVGPALPVPAEEAPADPAPSPELR